MSGVSASLSVHELEKWFGDTKILAGLSFDVARGEIVGLLGPNGAGKTTTLRAIAGVQSFDAGRVFIQGLDLEANRVAAIRCMGYMPENPPFYGEMTVESHLRFWARLRDVEKNSLEDRVDEAISVAGLEQARGIQAGKLSKGYRQRLGLAQSVVHGPSVLILDEPTSGLDPDQIVQTREAVRSFAGHKTVLVSTHILPDAIRMCDRVVIVKDGKIVATSPITESETLLERVYLDAIHGL